MAREGRGGVVSVRIPEVDQQRLRQIAANRGTSVSDLVRSAALREADGAVAQTATVTVASGSRAPEIGHGLIWETPEGAHIQGGTFTY